MFWALWGRTEPADPGQRWIIYSRRETAVLPARACSCAYGGLEGYRVNLGSSSHLLLLKLLEPHQMGQPDDQWGALGGRLYRWGLLWLGFWLVLRVTSGVAFLPLCSQSLVTCAL